MKEGKIKDSCIVVAGQSPKGSSYNEDGNGLEFHQGKKAFGEVFLQPSNVWTTEITKTAEPLDILMSVRAPVGPTNITNRKICIGRGLAAIRCKKDILQKYVLYALKNIETKIVGNNGAVFNSINKKQIEDLPLPILSLAEQQQIVSFLDSEFEKIDALKANAETQLQGAKDLFQKVLKEMLTPKDGWVEKKLGEVGNICGRIGFRGYTTKDMVNSPLEGAITLSPSNIQDGEMNYSKCQYISWFKYEESPEIMVQDGDVLIVKTGSSYGKSALVRNLPHKATINPQFVVIKDIKINNSLFAYLIKTPWVQKCFDDFVAGTAIPTFSQANLSKVELSFPINNIEQTKIVAHLDTLSAKIKQLEKNCNETITLCNDLKQSLLKKIFE